jgi:hypothetical protein
MYCLTVLLQIRVIVNLILLIGCKLISKIEIIIFMIIRKNGNTGIYKYI